MQPFTSSAFGNPSSVHTYGNATRTAVDKARQQVAALINCWADELAFTSCGTEADNWAIWGAVMARRDAVQGLPHVVTSAVEHPAVTKCLQQLQQLVSWLGDLLRGRRSKSTTATELQGSKGLKTGQLGSWRAAAGTESANALCCPALLCLFLTCRRACVSTRLWVLMLLAWSALLMSWQHSHPTQCWSASCTATTRSVPYSPSAPSHQRSRRPTLMCWCTQMRHRAWGGSTWMCRWVGVRAQGQGGR